MSFLNIRHFTLRFLIALLTFFIGVAIVLFWHFTLNAQIEIDSVNLVIGDVLIQKQVPQDENLSDWQILLSFEHQDLTKLNRNSEEKLRNAIDKLTPKTKGYLIPRLFTKISNFQQQNYFILIEESPLLHIPGGSEICVHLFTLNGKLLSSTTFPAGWRIALGEMEVMFIPKVGRNVLQVNSKPVINGADIAKQYYALVGEKLLLIRLEDSKGQLTRNRYYASNKTIGHTVIYRSIEEWEKAIESNDTAEALATLTLLGGLRSNPINPIDLTAEKTSEVKLADKVRSREKVRAALEEMIHSENEWIRDAAKLAEKVEYY